MEAQQVTNSILRQEDLNQDGRPDLTVISASFATDHDQVLVYDGGNNMQLNADWHIATDFTDDTWIFDTGGDGTAQMILRFNKEGDGITCSVYTDQNGDHQVAYSVNEAHVNITEPGFPSIVVHVKGNWFLPNEALNWNVRFQTDGYNVSHIDTYDLTDYWNRINSFKLDGKPDVEIQFVDRDQDGIPEFGTWRVLTDTPAGDGAARTWIWSNDGMHPPAQPTNALFWPYLTTNAPYSSVQGGVARPGKYNYFDVPPSISVNTNASSIRALFFPGYPIEQGFHTFSFQYAKPEQLNYVDFENAQAYYDLAEDNDHSPELHIRNRYFDKNDLYNGNMPSVTNEIRYSWNQSNSEGLIWDYKLGLAGRYPITSEVQLGDLRYVMVPYKELPKWVISKSWDYATFVAREAALDKSAEGIYTWGPLETEFNGDTSTLSEYLSGTSVIDISNAFSQISPGWRGDFAPELAAQARLYFSPIDHKLHLLKAHSGIWQIDASQSIRYANLGSGPYLDQLTYTQVITSPQTYTITSQLDIAPSHLVYGDAQGVELRQAQVPPSLFETLPPTNHAEWQTLGAQLKQNQGNIAPGDLHAMIAQFAGPALRIGGATLRDYRPLSAGGFRFVLDLAPNFSITGDDLLGMRGLRPGAYAIEYNGRFTVSPLTPPSITANATVNDAAQWQPNAVRVALDNTGLQDVRAATIELLAAPGGAAPTAVTSQTLDLLAGMPAEATLPWTPNTPGAWSLAVQVRGPDGHELTSTPIRVNILAAHPSTEQVVLAGAPPLIIGIAGLGLAMLAGLGGLIFWRQLGLARRKQVPNES